MNKQLEDLLVQSSEGINKLAQEYGISLDNAFMIYASKYRKRTLFQELDKYFTLKITDGKHHWYDQFNVKICIIDYTKGPKLIEYKNNNEIETKFVNTVELYAHVKSNIIDENYSK